jgi:hypothetical protein
VELVLVEILDLDQVLELEVIKNKINSYLKQLYFLFFKVLVVELDPVVPSGIRNVQVQQIQPHRVPLVPLMVVQLKKYLLKKIKTKVLVDQVIAT